MDRFAALYQSKGLRSEIYLAVRAVGAANILDFDARVQAVALFDAQPESNDLAALNKRVGNILEKTEGATKPEVDSHLLVENAEQALYAAINSQQKTCLPLFASSDYQKGLQSLTSLKEPINAFFDSVMVNADDEQLKQNRLALLAQLRALFTSVADISLL